MAAETLILYDIPTRGQPACWTPNPWKSRLMLNFKNVDYTTEWVEYPDIAAKFKEVGIAPDENEPFPYQIPGISFTAQDGQQKRLQGSQAIAEWIEKKWPSPSLHLDSPLLEKVTTMGLVGPLFTLLAPRNPRNILNPRSAEYFEQTRKEQFGMSLDQFEKSVPEDQVWQNATTALGDVAQLLKQDPSGPFFLGKTVSYADFVAVGAFQFYKRAEQAIFDRAMAVDPVLLELYNACRPWLERDGY